MSRQRLIRESPSTGTKSNTVEALQPRARRRETKCQANSLDTTRWQRELRKFAVPGDGSSPLKYCSFFSDGVRDRKRERYLRHRSGLRMDARV